MRGAGIVVVSAPVFESISTTLGTAVKNKLAGRGPDSARVRDDGFVLPQMGDSLMGIWKIKFGM